MDIRIADRLVELRREKGWSQEELAAKLGVSRQAVSKWERAESSPDTDNLIALARLYEISLDGLLLHDAPEREEDDLEAAAAWQRTLEEERAAAREKWGWLLTLVLMAALLLGGTLLQIGNLYPLLVTMVFLITGFLLDNWHPGWILFLSMPIYYIIAERLW